MITSLRVKQRLNVDQHTIYSLERLLAVSHLGFPSILGVKISQYRFAMLWPLKSFSSTESEM